MASSRVFKILNVAEKNDAAREISRIMGGGRVERVYFYYNRKKAAAIYYYYFTTERGLF